MAARWWGPAALLAVSIASLGAFAGCSAKPAADAKLCTPGNYVYCRCANRDEGTKLCNDDGMSFQACEPCPGDGDQTTTGDDGGTLPDDAGFEPVDSGPPPDANAPSISAACTGKLVVLGGSDQDLDAHAGVYKGGGVFDVSVSHGPGLRSNATIVQAGTALMGVYLSRYSLIVGTKFETTWSPPVSIGSANTDAPPSVASLGTQVKMVYRGMDGAFYAGTWSGGWDDATASAEQGSDAGPTAGRSGPALGAVGSSLVYGFATPDGKLARVSSSSSSSSWGAALTISSATTLMSQPAMATMNGGSKDLLMVYTGSDLALHSVTRDASNKAWNTPVLVDDSAQPSDSPAVAPMSNGRAMVVWKASNGQAFWSLYDPTLAAPWSAPAELVLGANPMVTGTPAIAEGKCGSAEIVVAYSEQGGDVSVLTYAGGQWTGPFAVGGMSKLTYVGVAELP
jgi:hypothetical protein